jgi:hypothetical protein
VRKEATGWKVKVIDFGLALPQKVVETSRKGSTARQKETIVGSSVAGTLDYGAPEQMGRRKEPVGPYSDVYGWAKTCCYALFGTTQPLMKHWMSVPEPLAELLGKCLEEDPKQRPAGFAEVLRGLGMREGSVAPASPVPVGREQEFDLEGHAGEAVAARIATTTRKKPKKSLVPWVLCGVPTLLCVALMVFGLVLGGGKKDGPESAERGNNSAGVKNANVRVTYAGPVRVQRGRSTLVEFKVQRENYDGIVHLELEGVNEGCDKGYVTNDSHSRGGAGCHGAQPKNRRTSTPARHDRPHFKSKLAVLSPDFTSNVNPECWWSA